MNDVDYPGCDLSEPGVAKALIEASGAGTVIHCAAEVPSFDQDHGDEGAARRNDALVSELIAARPDRIVFVSSMTVYEADDPMPVNEDIPREPRAGYAGAKRRAELALEKSGICASVLRLPGLFGGDRRSGLVFNAIRVALSGGKLKRSRPVPLWSAIHVDDAADVVLGIAEAAPVPYEVLNVGYPGPMNIGIFLRLVSDQVGGSFPHHDDGPVFEMKLDRLQERYALPGITFAERLQEMAVKLKGELDAVS